MARLWYLHPYRVPRKPVHSPDLLGNPRHGKAAALPSGGTQRWLPLTAAQDDFTPHASGSE